MLDRPLLVRIIPRAKGEGPGAASRFGGDANQGVSSGAVGTSTPHKRRRPVSEPRQGRVKRGTFKEGEGETRNPTSRMGSSLEATQYVGNGPSGQWEGQDEPQGEAGDAAASYATVRRRRQPGAILAESMYGDGRRMPHRGAA